MSRQPETRYVLSYRWMLWDEDVCKCHPKEAIPSTERESSHNASSFMGEDTHLAYQNANIKLS